MRASGGIVFHEPFGFHDSTGFSWLRVRALRHGTISEESTILGSRRLPCATRSSGRRRSIPVILMTGLDADGVVEAVRIAMDGNHVRGVSARTPDDYMVTNTSARAVNFIQSTARRLHDWTGVRVNR